jgi:predicted membrane channel-forming protein YqfA (hemolysin III family)
MIVFYTPRCKYKLSILFWLIVLIKTIILNLGPLMVFYAAAMFMFGFSAIYHLFNAKSKKEMTFWIRFDYAGICIMIAGSSTAPIYYGFACPQLMYWRYIYLTMIYSMCTISAICLLIPYFD